MKKVAIVLLGLLISGPVFAIDTEPKLGDTEENFTLSGKDKFKDLVKQLIEKQKNISNLTLDKIDDNSTVVTITTEDSTQKIIIQNSKLQKYFINALIMYGILLGTDALGNLVAKLTYNEDIEFGVYGEYVYAPGDLNRITIHAIILSWEWLDQNVPVFLTLLKAYISQGISKIDAIIYPNKYN
ncbi:MAG: hypothetical protein SZ59_C0001G0175 [candidate division TM6 bacterium GW2011_GWF2_28_16]|nr:MAG: hypothetical protein SZ59_C0001G0175 [candidate division TM6 bacterium GW2011_GWF2_28_16]